MLYAGYVGKGCLAIPQEVGAYPQWWYRKTQQGGFTTDAAMGVAEVEHVRDARRSNLPMDLPQSEVCTAAQSVGSGTAIENISWWTSHLAQLPQQNPPYTPCLFKPKHPQGLSFQVVN